MRAMEENFETVSVPPEFISEVRVLVELAQHATMGELAEEEQLALIVADQLNFDTAVAANAVLYLPLATAAWLTKKVADEYLWPAIRARIDAPTRAALDWLLGVADQTRRKNPDA